ncbi:YopX family protein [Empedobacter falsenii]
MREILFRGQRIDNGEWVYGYYAVFTGKNIIYVDWKAYEVMPESVDQYTGLKDKNGNKIFEGDFVIDNDGNKTVIVWIKEWSMLGCMFLEEFEKYQLNGISELDESMFWTFPIENNLIEIIGNIHEEK